MGPQTTLKQKVLLILLGAVLSFAVLELGLRLGSFIFVKLQEYENKRNLQKKGVYRILCVGESTTAIGGNNAYPRQLEGILNKLNIGRQFKVINKGLPGTNTSCIVSTLEKNLNEYRPNMVISMMGVMDTPGLLPYPNYKGFGLIVSRFKTLKLFRLLWAQMGATLRKRCLSQQAVAAGLKAAGNKKQPFYNNSRLKPLTTDEQVRKAEFLMREQRFSEAAEIFEKVSEKDCHFVLALAWCYLKQGKFTLVQELLHKTLKRFPHLSDKIYGGFATLYREIGNYELAQQYYLRANVLRHATVNLSTKLNYQKLKAQLDRRGVTFICVQYPLRSIAPLKTIFKDDKTVVFVDNENLFKEALRNAPYDEYFIDMFAGDFGHCSPKGNRLLAENIARVIVKEVFSK